MGYLKLASELLNSRSVAPYVTGTSPLCLWADGVWRISLEEWPYVKSVHLKSDLAGVHD